MRVEIADVEPVRDVYPGVPYKAVLLLLRALRAMEPLINAGRLREAETVLRDHLGGYGGRMADLDQLRIPMIFDALRRGSECTAHLLAALGLTRTPRAPWYLIVADQVGGRIWARERGIRVTTIMLLSYDEQVTRLYGLCPADVTAIIELRPAGPPLRDTLDRLIAGGVPVRPGSWRPPADQAHPALDLHGRLS